MNSKWVSRTLYILYTLGAIAIFLYLLFPSETIKKYLAFKVGSARPGYTLTIDRVRPAFPPGILLQSANLLEGEDRLLTIDEMRISPKLFSLLGSEPAFYFTGKLFNGSVQGEGGLVRGSAESENPRLTRLDAELAGIRVEEIEALQNISPHTVSGKLEGELRYLENPDSNRAEADLILSECTVDFETSLFNLSQISFSTISAGLNLQNMRQLEIRECVAKGSDLGGDISGAVTIENPPEDSALNLSGTLKPHPSLVAKLGEGVVSLLFRKNRGETAFPFQITGTLAEPRFALR